MYDLGDLNGPDGNAFMIMMKVESWMEDLGFSKKAIEKYLADAKSSNYDNLVFVSQKMVDKLNRMSKDNNVDESEDCLKMINHADKAYKKRHFDI